MGKELNLLPFSIILMIIQNAGNTNTYCLGNYSCIVSNTAWVFVGKALYVVFWTFILNLICSQGYKNISWFLVLFPFILFFILIGLFMINQGIFILQNSSLYGGFREGMVEGNENPGADAAKAAASKAADDVHRGLFACGKHRLNLPCLFRQIF